MLRTLTILLVFGVTIGTKLDGDCTGNAPCVKISEDLTMEAYTGEDPYLITLHSSSYTPVLNRQGPAMMCAEADENHNVEDGAKAFGYRIYYIPWSGVGEFDEFVSSTISKSPTNETLYWNSDGNTLTEYEIYPTSEERYNHTFSYQFSAETFSLSHFPLSNNSVPSYYVCFGTKSTSFLQSEIDLSSFVRSNVTIPPRKEVNNDLVSS
ncbi:unnamed protein product [Moneuplotes crassus]|uniref:Uncharacterized protein n=1 Tax=Euplotes crassus TaxID=5936 RepID=A0AAD2D493_EUPCR|nr:unnamed protein product [Moneuplotes crassus]